MYEDIGTLIRRGFETWRRNLKLAVPFVLMIAAMMLLAVIMAILIMYPLITASPGLISSSEGFEDPEQLMTLLQSTTNIGLMAAVVLIVILAMFLSGSFFTAGAIGMAKEATNAGKTALKVMWTSGKRHFLSLFLAEALTTIIILAGFTLLSLPFLSDLGALFESSNPEFGPLVLWIILIIAYGLLVSLLLAMVPYALVVEGLGPIGAIKTGVGFFLKNKMDVFLVWLVVMAVTVAIQFVAVPFSGSETASAIFSILSGVASILVISPLTTVWWTRLYMTRGGNISLAPPVSDEEVKYL
ncbi:MAG: hypothetical protein WCY97_00710 [Methanothrix sp.]|jgi:hypothetical protein|uniref:Membrane protein, putative n=1 Tax=Methanothrix harundinacea TaxID=301375 RepID=A0A101FW21_9EURY|nr:MAG: hypothetical protein APR56_02370 [Methanosaeta sp. SDB]KUK45377.1 MAG: Membrane protein, putative [Methanothrix harundinacea]MDD3709248.1 hypothetical protein [Methanothrix sp.]MDI9399665.1 hypothetical protein [Euryarchaeota archaeon]KUK97703.1 MAG: Membrane protein, putative [Methanothrix harundinacea]